MGEYDIFLASVDREASKDQLRENGARTATFGATYVTKSDGDLIVGQQLDFGCTFTGKPLVTSAPVIVQRPDPVTYLLPRVNCGVFRWVTQPSPAGLLYVGCFLYFTVDVLDLTGQIVSLGDGGVCTIEHHVRFEGVAVKALPDSILNGF